MHGSLSVEQFAKILTPFSKESSDVLLDASSDESPAGEYLKGNRALYRPLRNAYNIAQTSLQKLSLNPDPEELDDLVSGNQQNWRNLQEQLLEVLEDHSHDLECMVWLAIAQMFSDRPYAQLVLAIQLIDQSLQTFGEQVQPFLPSEKLRSSDQNEAAKERAELQCRPLKLLFGESEDSCQIAVPMRMLPLINDVDFSRYQREETKRDSLKQAVRSSLINQQGEVVERINDMLDALDALSELDKTLTQHFQKSGLVAPGSRFLRHALESNLQALRDLSDGLIIPWPADVRKAAREQSHPVAVESAEESVQALDSLTNSAAQLNSVGKTEEMNESDDRHVLASSLFDRNQAFQQLRFLSDYFKNTEPQSPVSYLLEKAIRWGYTPLPDLMNELLQGNTGTLSHITELTGMNMTDKTPIPGQPARGVIDIPGRTNAASITASTSTTAPDQPVLERKPITPQEVQVTDSVPELINEPEPAPSVGSSGPAGLSISNLDDLL